MGLAQIAPMHLYHARPWLYAVVAARAETAAKDFSLAQAHRQTHAGGLAIRADGVAISAAPAIHEQGLVERYLYPGTPGKPHPQFAATPHQERMQLQTADADASAVLEVSRCMATTGEKSDAFEGRAFVHS